MREIYDEQAKERQKLSHGRGVKGVENLPHLKDDSRDAVGKIVGVSGKSIDAAAAIQEPAIPFTGMIHRERARAFAGRPARWRAFHRSGIADLTRCPAVGIVGGR